MITIPFEKHPADLDGLIEQVIEAVRQAILEARKDNPIHTAKSGSLQASGSTAFYTFTLKDEWEPEAGSSIHVLLDPQDPERTIAGTVLSVLNAVITIMTETPLPQVALDKVALQENTAWLLEKLLASLQVLRAQGESAQQMVSKTFGFSPCYEGMGRPRVQIATFAPDADQVRAIALGMESERAFIIGPPGTGKTSTECLQALEYLHADKTVYLLAFTNVALDNAMKRLKQYCEASGHAHWIANHRLVRVGKTKDLAGEQYRDITLQGIVEQQMGTLVKERNTLQQEHSDLVERIARLSRALEQQQEDWREEKAGLQQRLVDAQAQHETAERQEAQRLQPILARLKTTREQRGVQERRQQAALDQVRAWTMELEGDETRAIIGKRAEYAAWKQTLREKRETLRLFRAGPWWKRFFAALGGVTVTTLSEEVTQAERDVQTAREAVQWCERNRGEYEREASEAENEVKRLKQEEKTQRAKQQRETPEGRWIKELVTQMKQDEQAIRDGDAMLDEAREEVERSQRRNGQVVARLSVIEEEERTMTARVLDGAHLIGATLTSLTTNPHLRTHFCDAVIIDDTNLRSVVEF